METQHYPCTPSHPEFPNVVLRPGRVSSRNHYLPFWRGINARLKHCRGGTRALLAGLWAGLQQPACCCARAALAGAWLSETWRIWAARPLCAAACPCLALLSAALQAGARGEKGRGRSEKACRRVMWCCVSCPCRHMASRSWTPLWWGPAVSVVEVKHYAGDIFGKSRRRPGARRGRAGGGRHIEKT